MLPVSLRKGPGGLEFPIPVCETHISERERSCRSRPGSRALGSRDCRLRVGNTAGLSTSVQERCGGGWQGQEVKGRDGGVRVRHPITSFLSLPCVEASLHMQMNPSSRNYSSNQEQITFLMFTFSVLN